MVYSPSSELALAALLAAPYSRRTVDQVRDGGLVKRCTSLLLLTLCAVPLFAQKPAPASTTEVWAVDKRHSSVSFRIRHLMSTVPGNFRDFESDITIDRANPANSSVTFTIQVTSIDTNETKRDMHLRSTDFFDVVKYPTITFRSTAVKPLPGNKFDVTGDLTMHGVTRRITLPVVFAGFGKDGNGVMRGGFELETTLNRKDYDITWNRAIDGGGVVLGDDVKVSIALEAMRKP